MLAAALGKVVRALQKHHRKALTPQGRQSVKKLMNHYGGKSAMPYVGAPKDFDRIALKGKALDVRCFCPFRAILFLYVLILEE